MQLIFCSSPLDSTKPDEEYEKEFEASKRLGIKSSFIDFDAFLYEGDVEKAIRKVASDSDEVAVYRGWMLSPHKYQALYEALKMKGINLINDSKAYKHCHYLPEWFDLLENKTPHSVWIEQTLLSDHDFIDSIIQKLKKFDSKPVIVKDYVKSEKHFWKEACFIPDSSDRDAVSKVVYKFLELRDTDLEGGLVFRQFVDFKPIGTHSKSNMPLTKEFRLFILDGEVIYWTAYWDEGNYSDEAPPIEKFANHLEKPNSRFYTMDIAQTNDDEWLIVELGDAQVSDLLSESGIDSFYRNLVSKL